MAFAGAVKGVGEVILAPGVFTYQATGAFLYGVTGEWQYKAQAESFARTTDALGRTFESPESFVTSVAEGFTSQFQRVDAAIERGDAFDAGAGLGNAGGQVALALEGARATSGAMPNFATAVTDTGATMSTVATATGAVVGPPAATVGISTANNTTAGGDATTVQENTPTKRNPSGTKQVPAAKPTKPAKPSAAYDRNSIVRGPFKKNAKAVKERDVVCQYCQAEPATTADHVIPAYDADAAVGAGIITPEEGVALVNDTDNLLGCGPSCNPSKNAQLPGNVEGMWTPPNPTQRAIDKMRELGTWEDPVVIDPTMKDPTQ